MYLDLSSEVMEFIHADYIPPFLPFVINTISFGMMLIAAFMYVSQYISNKQWAIDLAKTGQMTFTHYVSHLTIGLVILALLRGDYYSGELGGQTTFTASLYFIILCRLFYY